jgi:hypothetical protein
VSYNGSGTFNINSTGQPVVTGTVISSSTFNSLTADLGTGLTTAITKDGQTTTTAKIPFAQGISAAVASNFAAGTVAAPSIYLSTDTTTGLYRIGANNDGFAISGVKLLDLGSALLGITGALTVSTTLGVTGAATFASTLGVTGQASFSKASDYQAIFTGYSPAGGASASNGSIEIGAAGTGPRIQFNTAGNTVTYFDSQYDSASSSTKFRTRTTGTPIDVITYTGAGAVTIPGTLGVTGAATFSAEIYPDQTKGLVGTTTNNSAQTGSVGEYVEATIAAPVNSTGTDQYFDATSMSLTAGDWDVTGMCIFLINGATWTRANLGISSTAGNSGTGLVAGSNFMGSIWASSATTPTESGGTVASYRMSLSATTTIYLKAYCSYTAGTPQAGYGRLSARRTR